MSPASSAPPVAPAASDGPVVDAGPRVARLRRRVVSGKPQALVAEIAAWPVADRPRAVELAATWAIANGRPDQLAAALSRLPDSGWPAWTHPLRFVELVLQNAREWAGHSPQPGILGGSSSRPNPKALAQAPALIQALAGAGLPLEPDRGATTPAHPLLQAAQNNLVDVARALLDLGIDPDGRSRQPHPGSTWPPLARATSVEMAALLLSRGARAGAATPDGRIGSLPALAVLGAPVAQCMTQVVAAWRAAGGQWDEPMESTVFPSTTLPELAFDLAAHDPDASNRHASLQVALLSNGFPLDALAPDGRAWREVVVARGCPAAAAFARLSSLPAVGSAPRPRM